MVFCTIVTPLSCDSFKIKITAFCKQVKDGETQALVGNPQTLCKKTVAISEMTQVQLKFAEVRDLVDQESLLLITEPQRPPLPMSLNERMMLELLADTEATLFQNMNHWYSIIQTLQWDKAHGFLYGIKSKTLLVHKLPGMHFHCRVSSLFNYAWNLILKFH